MAIALENRRYKNIGVIGGGSFGTAVAKNLALKGYDVTVWCFNPTTAQEINQKHTNSRYLAGIKLPPTLKATANLIEAATDQDMLFLVTPSSFLLDTVRKLIGVESIATGRTLIACLTKGILNDRNGEPSLILDVLENYLPGFYKGNMVYVSGPSHAEELAGGKLTALVSASNNPLNAIAVREVLTSSYLRVFSSLDVAGVQICGAVKNVVAIAMGAIDAYKKGSSFLGDNAESFMLAGGLNEMMSLGKAMGATHAETFTSIAGIGDLDVTCRSQYGRNRRFGREIIEKNVLSKYKNIEDLSQNAITDLGYLPEGIFAASAAYSVLQKHNLKLPIFQAVYSILNKEDDPKNLIERLINQQR